LKDFVDEEAFSTYQSLQQHLQSFENSYKNLQKDDKFKKLKFAHKLNHFALKSKLYLAALKRHINNYKNKNA
jgi:uncharacterized protein (DUF342 family)